MTICKICNKDDKGDYHYICMAKALKKKEGMKMNKYHVGDYLGCVPSGWRGTESEGYIDLSFAHPEVCERFEGDCFKVRKSDLQILSRNQE